MDEFLTNLVLYIILGGIIGFFVYRKVNYRENLGFIISNILLLYKNFFHWNLSKIIIRIYSFLFGLIISSPFLAATVAMLYWASTIFKPEWIINYLAENKIDYSLVTTFFQHPFLFLGIILLLVIIISIFVFTFMYGNLLEQNLYKNYINGNKLAYFKNLYFDYKLIYKYFQVLCWVSLYLLIPIGVGFLALIILFGINQIPYINSQTVGKIIFGIISALLFFASVIYFIYRGITLSFSYTSLIYTDNKDKKALDYVKTSMSISKGKVWKIVGLGIPFLLVGAVFDDIINIINLSASWMVYITNILEFLTISGISVVVYISIFLILNRQSRQEEIIIVEENKEEILEKTSEIIEPKSEVKKKTIAKKKPIKKTITKKVK